MAPPAPALTVCACSSQAHAHRAENILRSETYRIWQIQGSDNGTVVLSVSPPSQIAKISLVNAGSQFVEVLASEDDATEDWYTIMPKCALRTEKEFLAETARDRQRSATLSPATSSKHWKRIKVVCSITPGLVDVKHSKNCFGLANLHIDGPQAADATANAVAGISPPMPVQCVSPLARSCTSPTSRTPPASISSAEQTPPTKARRLNPPSPSADDVASSKPFARSEAKEVVRRPADGATSKTAAETSGSPEADLRRKSGLNCKTSRQQTVPQHDQHRSTSSASLSPSSLTSVIVIKDDDQPLLSSSSSSSSSSGTARTKNSQPTKPLSSILEGVCFSIGGLENPERTNVRLMAQKLGASYSPAVDAKCTHLLCAISGTPKHKQALRDGKIVVSPDWVAESLRQKRKVDARQFAV